MLGFTYARRVCASSVRVRLLSFGPLRHAFAEGGEWRELPQGADVARLLHTLEQAGTLSAPMLRSAAVAVNQEYASADQVLADGDVVAILPPVSGGTDGLDHSGEASVQLVREPIAFQALLHFLKAGADGAVCAFDGIVRDNTRGRPTLHLDYEAYEEMALGRMHLLRAEALTRFKVREVVIVHRLGRLLVGETSVYIAVASAHRSAAFDACRWLIDTLKSSVPIWKKEQFVDGAAWADGEPFPDDLVYKTGR